MAPRFMACVAGLVATALTVAAGQTPAVQSYRVQGNVWVLVSGTVNAAVQIGDEGVLVVDTMTDALAEPMIAEIKRLAGDKPIRWIVNTHAHPDHTGGNAKVAAAGRSIIAGNFAGQAGQAAANFAQIIAHENAGNRLAEAKPALPVHATPAETFFGAQHEFFFNDEAVQLIHVPHAHSDGDVMVFFRGSDVIATGKVFSTTTYPIIDERRGGGIQGHLDALNRILDITVPRFNEQGGTMVIPGSGRLTNESDVDDYRNWMTMVKDRVQEMIKKKMTLAQVKAARPTLEYDGLFATPGWTTDQFVEAVYRSLSQSETPARRGSN